MPKNRISRRDFLKYSGYTILTTIFAGLGYSTVIEPGWIDVVEVELELARLPSSFSGYRIAHISDIHYGGWMNQRRLHQVIQNIRNLSPDLVVITGDFVIGYTWDESFRHLFRGLQDELTSLSEEHIALAVLGNHDYWTNVEAVRQILTESNVINLSNDVFSIIKNNEQLHIAGVDDTWEGRDRLDIVIEKIPEDGAAILLAHEPDFADKSAKTGKFDLQLSGHAHGGQIVLPFIGPPILPFLGKKYPSGLYRVGDMWQYTNRGVGMARLRVRFNCRPEITVVTLRQG